MLIGNTMVVVFGLATIFSPSYNVFVLLRVALAFGISAVQAAGIVICKWRSTAGAVLHACVPLQWYSCGTSFMQHCCKYSDFFILLGYPYNSVVR